MKQCQAVTLASTYSAIHRCLKKRGVSKVGKLHLCAHHRAFALRKRPA